MEDKNLQQENKNLKSKNEQLQAKLDAIEKSNQQKSKFQLWLGRIGLGFLLGSGLKSSMQQLYSELPANVNRDTLADVTTQVIWRFTRIGLLAILVALIPTILLWQQNKLLSKQNEKIDSQIQLEESSRRGNLIVMMSNIMDKVDEEIRRAQEQGDSSRSLSPQLIGRIGALSYAFRPYRFWQDSMLIIKPLSPERGQLLLALVNSDLDSATYRNIYQAATFGQAYLEGANLGLVDLRNALLTSADLRNAFLASSDLRDADLRNADLNSINLDFADLRGALLTSANLKNTRLGFTDLRNALLTSADLRNTHLGFTDLRDADLSLAKVNQKDWLNNLEEWEVKGNKQILEKYEIDTVPQKDNFGDEYYSSNPNPNGNLHAIWKDISIHILFFI